MIVYHRGPFDCFYYVRQLYLFSRAFAGGTAGDSFGAQEGSVFACRSADAVVKGLSEDRRLKGGRHIWSRGKARVATRMYIDEERNKFRI